MKSYSEEILQKNYDLSTNSLVLVASTCDFSETSLDQSFDQRKNCFPLRNDFKYDLNSGLQSSNKEGNGIYFRMISVSSTITYVVKIWGFIDKCYNSTNTGRKKDKTSDTKRHTTRRNV